MRDGDNGGGSGETYGEERSKANSQLRLVSPGLPRLFNSKIIGKKLLDGEEDSGDGNSDHQTTLYATKKVVFMMLLLLGLGGWLSIG